MDWLQIIALALIQGVTEFLPISSSAHLILPSQIWGWPDQGLAFDVAVHLGTLVAVIGYFRIELAGYLESGKNLILRRPGFGSVPRPLDPRLDELLKIAGATLPLVVVGFLLKDWISDHLRSIAVIAAATIGFGLLLGLADRNRGTAATVSWLQAGVIGAAQILALVPGTSRSGITITAALWLGLSRTTAARFSFLLAIPAIGGAALLLGADLVTSTNPVPWSQFAAGIALAALSAYLCIASFVAFVERTGMLPFVIYRLLLGLALIWLIL